MQEHKSGMVALALILGTIVALPAAAELEWSYQPRTSDVRADPLPPADLNLHLMVDDDSNEGVLGVGGTTALQFMWLNRFTPPVAPVQLEEIWVLFPSGANMVPGAAVDLVVYHDPDGDPSNGADLVATFDETIQVADDNTFSVYTIDPPLQIFEPGDVLIGVIDRFVTSGVTPMTWPASMDVTASQGRSWLAVWTTDPPDPAVLPADGTFTVVDSLVAGNWMIRAFGDYSQGPAIPTTSRTGLLFLIVGVALAGMFLLVKRLR